MRKHKLQYGRLIFPILLFVILIGFFIIDKDNDMDKIQELPSTGVIEKSDSIVDNISVFENASQDSGLSNKVIEKKSSQPYYGIDLSHYQGGLVKEMQMPDSISFVICKASEGLHRTDPYFNSNWQALSEINIIRGAYHFYHCKADPIRQAENFIKTVGSWETKDITPIIDIDSQSLAIDQSNVHIAKLQQDLLSCLKHVENNTGRTPMIYTNLDFANTYLNNSAFSRYPLWLAHYTKKSKPTVPVAWKNTGFMIWQRTDSYHFKSSIEDFDIYYGDLTNIYK